ncbi:helix-turn-helix domain-containing protein [Streptomyces sp. NPDC057638]|uniref:helix-turn-helix domain-containing protein n=1 Tax=Streptomyces sp. NPDC057638 TaxID=3346190 RepID=UPI00368C4BE6
MTTDDTWAASFSKAIAAQVRHHRTALGMSAQQLSDRCAELGLPMARSVLANFESGRRPTVSVPEWLVLAKALGVAPVALLCPVAEEGEVEIVPGHAIPPYAAMQWVTGEGPLAYRAVNVPEGESPFGVSLAAIEEWQDDRAGLMSYRALEDLVKHWQRARMRARASMKHAQLPETTEEQRESLHERAREEDRLATSYEPHIRRERDRLRKDGLRLPSLPDPLTHLDAPVREDWRWLTEMTNVRGHTNPDGSVEYTGYGVGQEPLPETAGEPADEIPDAPRESEEDSQ